MTILDADEISRVALLQLTDGSATSLEDAQQLFDTRQLVLCSTRAAVSTACGQAALLTAAVTAIRTFGAVHVTLPEDARVVDGIHRGQLLSDALRREGASLGTDPANPEVTVIVLGDTDDDTPTVSAGIVLYARWNGWKATVSPTHGSVAASGNVVAAIAAAALAVSEAFAHARGVAGSDAGYRTLQLNLLGPENSTGPDLRYAPAAWWLVGLGHLGQAYSWVISQLPYIDPSCVDVTVQDTDRTSPANHSTSVLTPRNSRGIAKTRLVAARLEEAGFRTRILEWALDEDSRLRNDEIHTVALIGVDNLPARRALSAVGWPLTIDMGLGAGAHDHTAISMHRFPGSKQSQDMPAWQDQSAPDWTIPGTPGFDDLNRRFDQCGVLTLAGKAIGVPFVGIIAACLAVTEASKQLNNIPGNEVVGIDVSTGHHVSAPAIRHARIASTALRPQ